VSGKVETCADALETQRSAIFEGVKLVISGGLIVAKTAEEVKNSHLSILVERHGNNLKMS